MESEEDVQEVRLIPIGVTEQIKQNPYNSIQQNEYLRACLSKHTETINYLKEIAISANLQLDPTRIIDST